MGSEPMTLKNFRTVRNRDFANGAVRDEIETALKERETLLKLCRELDEETDGVVRLPASACAVMMALRRMVDNAE